MLGLVVSLVIGLVIGIVYMYTSKEKGYNRDFIIGLTLLPAIVSIVILLVGSNVARAFSMAGAFALVRFRSAPGSAKDISIVFFSMAAGLACGLGFVLYAAVFTVIILIVLIALSFSGFGREKKNLKQLKITIPENLNYPDTFGQVFDKFTDEAELRNVKTTNMGTLYELTYYVVMKASVNEKAFIDDLRVRNGNLNIVLGILPDKTGATLN